jgi:hypothetical protein
VSAQFPMSQQARPTQLGRHHQPEARPRGQQRLAALLVLLSVARRAAGPFYGNGA